MARCLLMILLPRKFLSSDAMDMHMYGFKTVWSSDTSCIMLFFSSWLLDTKVMLDLLADMGGWVVVGVENT
jgi:hypothetical protein